MRRLVIVLALATLASCSSKKPRDLDHSLIHVTGDARLRTDTVGDGKFADLSTFVLVEAENTATDGAYVTLGGELADETDHTVGILRAQSIYVPAGEKRTFALVDKDRKPRPTAKAARIRVRGARVAPMPPPAHVEGMREIPDGDKTVVQGVVKNEAARGGNIMVIATFYDREGKPMTRPFSVVWVEPSSTQAMQFVGPPGSTHATMFIGDVVY
ncbi:MAG: hypothetical protein HOV81_37770 [Kofleriaceae bacterium]|nr:hypothetical protein [Kofleriaceae bacterium]